MENKLELAINTIYDALTTVWEDNGNIMADAVRDSVITNLSKITGKSFEEIETKVEGLIEDAQ
jgi:translation initiation factor 2 alpha subunit (eIF-2alpha)